jgi:N4-gp56 family major capsid protein
MSVVTTATKQDVIAAMVQQALYANAQLIFTVQDHSDKVGKGAKSVSFPRSSKITPASKTAGTPTTAQALTYSVDKLDLTEISHVYVKLEDVDSIQSVLDVEAEILKDGGAGMAEAMDTYIYEALRDGASSSTPTHVIDWFGSSGTLAKDEFIEAAKLLDLQNVPASDRFFLINPNQKAEIMALSDFIDASKYGSPSAIQNGEIGMVMGFKVICSTVCEDDVALAYHRSALAFAMQKQPTWESDRDLAALSNEYSLSALYGAKVLDGGKRVVKGDNQD